MCPSDPSHAPLCRSAPSLCFTSLPPFPPDALTLAPEPIITLKTAVTAATLLPEDSHYDVARLTRCFLRPTVPLGGRGRAHGTQEDDEDQDDAWAGDHWGEDQPDWDGQGGGVALRMVQVPAMPDAVQVPYARRAKQVGCDVCQAS